jgi:hypothetical protein
MFYPVKSYGNIPMFQKAMVVFQNCCPTPTLKKKKVKKSLMHRTCKNLGIPCNEAFNMSQQ